MGGTRFMVQWEEHPSHLATRLGQLLEHQTLVDVTLMCNTHTLRVHRAVLAACSPYFETILQRQLGMHPLIVLKDMQFSVLKSLIEFMYCGETSVTEDNLGALLQAAKFFQVKGLSAMTKEALGLSPSTKSTINGDAARKAFVGRPKRVGMQQTFVTSGLKTLPASHASSSHTNASANELPILPTKTTFQTISKPITARPDTQQQADTAQLLLSLSGSEFPKQTFHTVSKNVRFQHNVSGSTVSIDSARSSSVEGNVKAKEVVGRIPVMASNGGKTTIAAAVAGAAATTTATTTVSQQSGQIIDHTSMGSVREDVLVTNPQSVYLAEGHRRRGRPVKRQMNMLFQERVMTDADAALHKEAEASRKALEMLRQEMSSETIESSVAASSNLTVPVTPAAVVPSPVSTSVSSISQMSNVAGEHVQKGLVKHSVQGGTKIQVQSIQTPIATTSRTVTASQNVSSLVTTKKMNTNVYKTTNNTVSSLAAKKNLHPVSSIPNVDISNSNSVSSICKVEEPEMSQAVYELSNETTQEPIKEESVEYQVGGESVEGEEGGRNANIVYQVADSNSASAGSVMSQYMEVLKEAGLPTDVPILLDSGDGSYVTVNEEVLMNIVNGGVLQCHVTEGNFVAGDGVEFIVQEITEDEMEAVQAQVQEQSGEGEPLPKEVENNSEATANAESLPSTTDVKLPVEEETQLVECTETQENKQVVSQEEISQPDDQAMEINSDLLPNNESVQQESQEPQNETVGLCPEETLIKEDIIPEETSEGTSDGNEQTETKYESDLQTVVSKDEDAFESEACSTELQNNENDQENVKNENNENEMSVEQALQAMMGESSDTELESCTNNDVQGTSKDESVVSGLETISQSLKEEKSDDLHLVLRSEEGTEEDLRLVLSNDAGDANDDSSYTLTIAPSTADEKDSLLPEGGQKNSDDQEDTVVTVLPTDTTQEIGVQECVTEAPIPTSNEFESVTEQSDEIEHVVEPLQVESVSKEVPSPLGCVSGDDTNIIPKMEEELEGGESTEYMESVPGSEVSGDSQEVSQLTSNTEASSAEAVCNSASEYSKPQGAIISPSKDIPYAVGLLPLKTALEKLQAMPEYHPRKTRSSSTGKESTPDMPAARVKRKASSSDGADKRLKLSAAEGGTIMEQPTAEEICDGDTTMEVVASSISEERNEETILSMPELMTEPTEG